jgi:hypothetical protein
MGKMTLAAGLAFAVAVSPAAAAPRKAASADDPEREICKSQPVVGSRLKRIRVCMTAQQWEELQLQEQLGMIRRQTNGDAGCNYNPGMTGQCGVMNGGRDTPF